MPTFAEMMVSKLETAIQQLVDANVAEYTLPDGRRVRKQDLPELIKMRDKFKAEVRAEQAAASIAAGLGNPNKIKVRF